MHTADGELLRELLFQPRLPKHEIVWLPTLKVRVEVNYEPVRIHYRLIIETVNHLVATVHDFLRVIVTVGSRHLNTRAIQKSSTELQYTSALRHTGTVQLGALMEDLTAK